MLGVRREGVTEAGGKLRVDQLPAKPDHGARSPGSGGAVVRVLPVVKTEFDRLLPYVIRYLNALFLGILYEGRMVVCLTWLRH
jgi:hypothetical protein